MLGAEFSRRHDGAVPLLLAPLGAAAMAAVLWPQAVFGLADRTGPGRTLSEVSATSLSRAGDGVLMTLVTASMAGWLALNLAVGGTATSAWTGLPEPVAIGLHGVAVLLLGLTGIARWNRVAALAACASALLAVSFLTGGEGAGRVVAAAPAPALLAGDIALFVGYVAVFAVRAPDFTAGLARRRHVALLVAALTGATLVVAGAGAVAADAAAGQSVVAALLSGGNRTAAILLSLSTLAPALASQHSGALGLARLRLPVPAPLVAGVVGTALAIGRFDLLFAGWLELLAVAAPPVILPLGVERLRRRGGRAPRIVPLWTWLPGAVAGVALAAAGDDRALAAGAAVTAAATAVWAWSGRRRR